MKYNLGPWVDAHCHLADPRFDESRDQMVAQARERGIQFFMQGGVGPEDWKRQLELVKVFPLGLCFGLHPYWVADHDDDECEAALNDLAPLLPKAKALGEVGLDLRPHIMKDSYDRQLRFFEDQLELAEAANLPVVLHLVQAHEEAMKVFRMWGPPRKKGIVHSFNGSSAKAKEFVEMGLSLSVGGPVARPDNLRLKQAVRETPPEFLLLETDAPDQPPPAFQNELNPPVSLMMVAEEVGHLKGMTAMEILDISTSNFRRIFGSFDGNTNSTGRN